VILSVVLPKELSLTLIIEGEYSISSLGLLATLENCTYIFFLFDPPDPIGFPLIVIFLFMRYSFFIKKGLCFSPISFNKVIVVLLCVAADAALIASYKFEYFTSPI
jgi:hypothetical protein